MDEKGRYDPVKHVWVCALCGKICKNEGGLNLHYYRVHGRRGNSTGQETCPICGSRLRLLSRQIAAEAAAIAQGYLKICPKCEEVI